MSIQKVVSTAYVTTLDTLWYKEMSPAKVSRKKIMQISSAWGDLLTHLLCYRY